MKLLLTSSGFATPELETELLALVGKPRGSFRSVFIPTAADPEADKSFVESARRELAGMSASVDELDLKAVTPAELGRRLEKADLVFVNGGNTFYLLHHANGAGLKDCIRAFLARGGVYVGVSAGSILASPTIAVAGFKGYDDPRVVELPSLKALALVDFHLFVHDDPKWDALVAEESKALGGELIRLRDGEAVSVHGGNRRVLKLA